MENKIPNKNINDIEVAERKYLINKKNKRLKKILFPSLIFIFLTTLSLINKNSFFSRIIFNRSLSEKNDNKILGHFPYEEVVEENLIEVQPNIKVHKNMYKSLIKMKEDAKKDNVYIVFLSGYRSIKLQNEIFYSLKSLRNQNASERARVSAPPGYSEHSTGFAIDIGDALNRETDFEIEFENTNAFKWLKKNAAKYHFKLSFDRGHKDVDYEPWHWRYEGSIEALKVFEKSNRKFYNFK